MPPRRTKRASAKGAGRRQKSSRPRSLRDFLTRRTAWVLWMLGLLWWLGVVLYPPSLPATRFSGVVFAVLLLLGFLGLAWRYRALRWSLLAGYVAVGVFLVLPGHDRYDRVVLRESIAAAARRYQGVRVSADGENRLAISMNGLVRRATVEGTLRYGLETLNPYLIRSAFELWWSGLPDLARPPRRQFERLLSGRAFPEFDPGILFPGDIAAFEGGGLFLFYLGGGEWLETASGRVTAITLAGETPPAYSGPLSIYRWRFLKARRPDIH